MNKPLFTGTCTAMVTPFLGDQINYPLLEMLLERQISAGIPAVVICGTTGEAPTLSDKEKETLFRFSKTVAGNRMKIIAGTGSNDTKHAVALSRCAEKCGADGILVVSPYYNKATHEGLYLHYKLVADSIDIPLIVYNVPSRTGLDIPVSVYQRLCTITNIAGVKEASPSMEKILQIKTECSKDFHIWAGSDDLTVPTVSVGGKGVISVLSNLFPAQMQAMTMAALTDDYGKAAALQRSLYPISRLISQEINPVGIKAAMKLHGLDCGGCRLPLSEPTAETLNALKDYLA